MTTGACPSSCYYYCSVSFNIMLSYVKDHPYLAVLSATLSSPLWLFPIHFLAVVLDLPLYLRPYTGLKKGGEFFSWVVYEGGGTLVGWCWYACLRAFAFVRDVLLERLWPSLKQTFVDLWNGLHDYFDVSVFWDAVQEQVLAFWEAHQPSIMQGALVVATALACVGVTVYWWYFNCGFAAVVGPGDDGGDNDANPVLVRKRVNRRE